MSDLGDEVADQLELAEAEKAEEPHRADSQHLDDPHGLLTKPGLKGAFSPDTRDKGKASGG